MAVQRILKAECASAMPYMVAGSLKISGAKISLTRQNSVRTTATPITLNIRCTTAARRAFLLVPIEESMAVTVVPMF